MSFTIAYNAELDIIEVSVQRNLDLPGYTSLITQIADTIQKNNCMFLLSDFRDVTLLLSTPNIYLAPRLFDEICSSKGININRVKRALVASNNLKDYFFYETVTLNTFQTIKIFTDMDEARRWLLQK